MKHIKRALFIFGILNIAGCAQMGMVLQGMGGGLQQASGTSAEAPHCSPDFLGGYNCDNGMHCSPDLIGGFNCN